MVLSTRISSELRARLEAASERSGRTLSFEIQHRLDRSFDEDDALIDRFGGRQIYAILRAIAAALAQAGETAYFLKRQQLGTDGLWLSDPYAYDQAVRVAVTVLEALRPPGPIDAPTALFKGHELEEKLGDAVVDLGGGMAIHMLAEIEEADPEKPTPAKAPKRAELARRIKADLGDLSKNIRGKK